MRKRTWGVWLVLCVSWALVSVGCGSNKPGSSQDGSTGSDAGVIRDTSGVADVSGVEREEQGTQPGDAGPAEEAVVEERAFPKPVSIETRLDKTSAKAGELVTGTCEVTDQYGDTMADADTKLVVTPVPQGTVTDTTLTIEKPGTYTVACQLKDDSLTDDTPETLTITVGVLSQVDTLIDPTTIRAGEHTKVSCPVFDAYKNPISDPQPTSFKVDPMDGITIEPDRATGTKVGLYRITCQIGPIADPSHALLEIIPGLPSRIEFQLDPKQDDYRPGDTLLLDYKVYDKYGNEITDPKVKITFSPDNDGIDKTDLPVTVTFNKDGTYKITITVDGPTESGQPLSKTVTAKVDGRGPTILISYPSRGAMLTGSSSITVRGRVYDTQSGVASLSINGQSVTFNTRGEFSFPMRSKWGLNLIEVETRDKNGNPGYRAQSYLWSSSYKAHGARIGKGLVGRLNQRALDDGNRSTLNDLASILEKVINALDINALIPYTLVSGKYKIPPFGPTVSYRVTKNGTVTMGRRRLTLKTRSGGLAVWARVENIRIPLKGYAAGFLSKTATITASSVELNGTINLSYSNGNVSVSVPSLSADVSRVKVEVFSGIFSFLNGLVTSALRSRIKSALENAIKGAIPDPVRKFLTGFKLNTSIPLPRQLGSKRLNISTVLDQLTFYSTGGVLGLGTTVSATRGIPSGKRGTPLRSQYTPGWSSSAYAFGAGIAYNSLNQALVAAWYSGAFNQDLSSLISSSASSSLPLSPKNLKFKMNTLLPPILHYATSGYNAVVGIGDMYLDLSFELQGQPATARAYVTASFGANLSLTSRNEISIQLATTPLTFAADVVSFSGFGNANPSELSQLLKQLAPQISQFISKSILQKFPIPTIDLSSFGGKYGIPAGTKLTIYNGKMVTTGSYLRITGELR